MDKKNKAKVGLCSLVKIPSKYMSFKMIWSPRIFHTCITIGGNEMATVLPFEKKQALKIQDKFDGLPVVGSKQPCDYDHGFVLYWYCTLCQS